MRNHYLCVILVAIFAMFQNSAQESEACNNIKKYLPKFSRCCDMPDLEKSEKEKRIVSKCDKSIRKNYRSKLSRQEKEECVEECFFRSAKLMTPDMHPDGKAITADYEIGFDGQPEWEEAILESINECAKIDFEQPESKCKSGALQFSYCVKRKLFVKCPKESWIEKDDDCLKTKKMFEKCDVKRRRLPKRIKDSDSDEDDD